MWSAIRPAAAAALRASPVARITTSRVGAAAGAKSVLAPGVRVRLPVRLYATAGAAKKTTAKKASGAAKKKKAAPKKQAAPKAKKPRKVLTPEEAAKKDIRELKKIALLKEPETLPDRPWLVFTKEQLSGDKLGSSDGLASAIRAVAEAFKALSPAEKQRLETVAEQNKQKNKEQYRLWVDSHTPQEIYDANKARTRLRNKYKVIKKQSIKDDRLPKQPLSAFLLFSKSKWATHDYSGQSAPEVTKQIAGEWKTLPDTDRQPFFDLSGAELDRYEKEVRDVFGRALFTSKKSPSP